MTDQHLVVTLATAWGATKGGVNSFNSQLSCSLGQIPASNIATVAVVLKSTSTERRAAAKSGVQLIDINSTAERFDPFYADCVEKLLKPGEGTKLHIIGHDAITGGAANRLAVAFTRAQSLVIMHSSYADYSTFKHSSSSKTLDQVETQRAIFSKAERVAGVGPLLTKRLVEFGRHDAKMIVPGFVALGHQRVASSRLTLLTYGRFSGDDERLKQAKLAVEGFAKACEQQPSLLRNAQLRILGIPPGAEEDLNRLAATRAKRFVEIVTAPFIDRREALQRHLRQADLGLVLSWHEGFSLAAWEMLGAGLPLVVSRNSGFAELLDEETAESKRSSVKIITLDGAPSVETTRSYTERDVDQVSLSIVTLAENIDRYRREADQVREVFTRRFPWPNTAQSVLSLLGIQPSGQRDITPKRPRTVLRRQDATTDAVTFSPQALDDGFAYLAAKFKEAKNVIEHAAFSPPIPGWDDRAKSYQDAIAQVIHTNKVFYRYVGGLAFDISRKTNRIHGIIKWLSDPNTHGAEESRYTPAGYYMTEEFLGFNFHVFDREEAFLYYPGAEGEPGTSLVSRNQQIVSSLVNFYHGLWNGARKFHVAEEAQSALQQLSRINTAILSSTGGGR